MVAERIRTKRIYNPVEESDGTRVLVDGVWPRGIKKADSLIDYWYKQIAPTKGLRQWFGHDPERWPGFRDAYRKELAGRPELLRELLALCRRGPVTLVFGARDREHNQAVVLREVLAEELSAADRPNDPASPVCYDGFHE